jgi:hypothetical protein
MVHSPLDGEKHMRKTINTSNLDHSTLKDHLEGELDAVVGGTNWAYHAAEFGYRGTQAAVSSYGNESIPFPGPYGVLS